MARTLLCIALVACWGLLPACARIDQSAAVRVEDLKEDKSTSASCMKSKRMPSRYFAVAVSGQDALIGDHAATFDNETKTITTTTRKGNDTVSIVQEMDDDGDEAELYYYVNKTDGYCVYEVDVKSGKLLGVRGDDPSAEAGIVEFAGLDEQLTTRSADSCSRYRVNATQAAYVQEKSDDDDDKEFAFATVEGKVDKHNPDVGALQREESDRTLGYLTATNGTVYLSTDINDAKTGPAGCVFRLSVVDGSVFGVTSEGGNNNDTTTATNTTSAAEDTTADQGEYSSNSTVDNESSSSNTTTTGAEYTGEGTGGRRGRDADSVDTTSGSNVEDGVATETDGSATTTTTTSGDNGRTRRLRRWSQ